MNRTTKPNLDDDKKLQDIRTDLWPTMTINQLYNQQELIITKIRKLQSILTLGDDGMAQAGQDSSTMTLYKVLRQASMDLGVYIESKYEPRHKLDLPKVTLDG